MIEVTRIEMIRSCVVACLLIEGIGYSERRYSDCHFSNRWYSEAWYTRQLVLYGPPVPVRVRVKVSANDLVSALNELRVSSLDVEVLLSVGILWNSGSRI